MADNTVIDLGVGGDTIADDDIGGVKFQRVKLIKGIDGVNDGDIARTNPWPVEIIPVTSGGCLTDHLVSAGSTNAANIKASAGQVYGVHVYNNALYPIYVKLHNTAGTPTAGTGVVRTIGVQAGMQVSRIFPAGIAFSTGIGRTIVKGIADADAVAVLASDCVVDVDYV